MTWIVEAAGALTLVEDLGRPGRSELGVSESGAFDRQAAHQANALVGNPDAAAVLECLGGGLELRATADHLVAITGAVGPVRPAHGHAALVRSGERLSLGPFTHGSRGYVAVAGGFVIDPVLGSASSDTLGGIGPQPLAEGDELEVGASSGDAVEHDAPWLGRTGDIAVDVVLGPRDDWFTDDAVRTFLQRPWSVSPHSDRVGVRLDGPALERVVTDELPSEPCVRGSVQVASDGHPIVLGPDHPVTGGYPVIAVVVDAHTDRLAQARPGDAVRFRQRRPG